MATFPAAIRPPKPRVFVDADVLFAGAASPSEHGASLIVLRLAELTLLDAITSQQVKTEAERNLAAKLPAALPALQLLLSRCLTLVPSPTAEQLLPFVGLADGKDVPILAAAVLNNCPWLVTFNVRHFQPSHPSLTVLPPGDFVRRVRYLLSSL